MLIIFTYFAFTFTSEHVDILKPQKVAGECVTITEKEVIQLFAVLLKIRSHAASVGALSTVGIIAIRLVRLLPRTIQPDSVFSFYIK